MGGRKRVLLLKLLVIAVLSALICLNRLAMAGSFISDVPALLLTAFGGAMPFEGLSIYDSLSVAAPVVAQFALFAEYIGADMPTVSVYVFSRTRRRDLWLFGKMGRLIGLSLLCHCVLLAAGACVGLLAGLKAGGSGDFLMSIGLLAATSGVWDALMLCPVAVCCLKNKAQSVISVGAGVFIVWVFAVGFLPAQIVQWVAPLAPMTHSLLAAHSDVEALAFLAARLGERTYELPLWWSVLYFVLFTAAFAFVSRRWIMRTDFTETR
jgi:hypothetical protein